MDDKNNIILDEKEEENELVNKVKNMIIKNNICLPKIMINIKEHLEKCDITICTKYKDGRKNSIEDEETIKKLLLEKFPDNIKVPIGERWWYDILVKEECYGWIPVNIKVAKLKEPINCGNLSLCVYSYTDEKLEFDKQYNNGEMTKILKNKLDKKEYNNDNLKDYYFLVINKENTKDIIINGTKGLSELTPNINNLPFQIKWDKNREYKYGGEETIEKKIKEFIICVRKPKPSWTEKFLENIRNIDIEKI